MVRNAFFGKPLFGCADTIGVVCPCIFLLGFGILLPVLGLEEGICKGFPFSVAVLLLFHFTAWADICNKVYVPYPGLCARGRILAGRREKDRIRMRNRKRDRRLGEMRRI